MAMRIIIELDGPVFDARPWQYAAHVCATKQVGWSRLDEGTFWRTLRKKGTGADLLRGAREAKIKEYASTIATLLEADDALSGLTLHEDIATVLPTLAGHGELIAVSLGTNVSARRAALDRQGVSNLFQDVVPLNPDPKRRPGELRLLAGGARRSLLVSSSDTIVRSGSRAEVFTVGVSTGPCGAPRLHQAGADVVYRHIEELSESLDKGAHDLIQAGMSPPSLG